MKGSLAGMSVCAGALQPWQADADMMVWRECCGLTRRAVRRVESH